MKRVIVLFIKSNKQKLWKTVWCMVSKCHTMAVYPLPKRTNSQKLLFISISCIYITFCEHIVKYLYKLMLCWKFHIIPTRTFIYIFLVTCVWGIPLTSVHAQKLKIEIYRLWLLHWTFPFFKAFQKIVFYFYFNSFTMLRKIAAMTNSIEGRYETDTCSVSHGKSPGSCNVKCYFRWMRHLCVM